MYSIGPAVLEEIGYRQTHILLLYIGDRYIDRAHTIDRYIYPLTKTEVMRYGCTQSVQPFGRRQVTHTQTNTHPTAIYRRLNSYRNSLNKKARKRNKEYGSGICLAQNHPRTLGSFPQNFHLNRSSIYRPVNICLEISYRDQFQF